MIQYPGFPIKNLLPGTNGLLTIESCCWDTSAVQSATSSSKILPGILRSPALLLKQKDSNSKMGESSQAEKLKLSIPIPKPRTYPPWTRLKNGDLVPVPKPRSISAMDKLDGHFSAVILKEIPTAKPRLTLDRKKIDIDNNPDKENLNISKSQEFKQWAQNYEKEIQNLGGPRKQHQRFRVFSPHNSSSPDLKKVEDSEDMNSSRETDYANGCKKPWHKRVVKYWGNKLFSLNVKQVPEHKLYESNF